MQNENSEYSILEFLQKNGAANTFKLARVLEINRDGLLRILKNLKERELVKIVTGRVEFLSYPPKEKKEQKSKIPKEKAEVQTLQEEVERQKLYAEKLKAQIKKLEQRPPKIVTKTIIRRAEPKVITRTIVRDVKPIKIKEAKIKPMKIKKSIKLRKKFKKIFRIKKAFRKLGPKIGEGLGIFKIKDFIKKLKWGKNEK